jgi:hypothetical protein
MFVRGLVALLFYLNITLLIFSLLWFSVPFFRQYSLSDYYSYSAIVVLILSALVAQGSRRSRKAIDNKNNRRTVSFLLMLGSILLIKSFVLALV